MKNRYNSIWRSIIIFILIASGIKVSAQYVPVYDSKGKSFSVEDRKILETQNTRVESSRRPGTPSKWEQEYDRKEQMKLRNEEARKKADDAERAADAERLEAAKEEKKFKARYREIGATDENGLRMVVDLQGDYGFVNRDNNEIICTCYEEFKYANGYYGLNLSGSWALWTRMVKRLSLFCMIKLSVDLKPKRPQL
jgi:hypothetical protein